MSKVSTDHNTASRPEWDHRRPFVKSSRTLRSVTIGTNGRTMTFPYSLQSNSTLDTTANLSGVGYPFIRPTDPRLIPLPSEASKARPSAGLLSFWLTVSPWSTVVRCQDDGQEPPEVAMLKRWSGEYRRCCSIRSLVDM